MARRFWTIWLVLAWQATAAADAGEVFRDCPECPEMVVVPAGRFDMGSPNHEADRFDNEGPVHHVSIKSFALAKTHITRSQYASFVTATGYQAGNECWTFEGGKYEKRKGRNWQDPAFVQKENHPAVCLNWDDAKAYIEWLSRKTGKSYRLPTEAEFEYATRAGTSTARWWGESADQACRHANLMDRTGKMQILGINSEPHNCWDNNANTAAAGVFKPNAFGLHDMLGNAWQWTEDCWHDNYSEAPMDGSGWTSECSGELRRVLRGGSWFNSPHIARSAGRYRNTPTSRYGTYGFRPAMTLP